VPKLIPESCTVKGTGLSVHAAAGLASRSHHIELAQLMGPSLGHHLRQASATVRALCCWSEDDK